MSYTGLQSPRTFHLSSVSSTNDYAAELIKQHPFVMVSADYQTKGRGRSGRMWTGDYGANVYCSFGFNHELLQSQASQPAIYMGSGALSAMLTVRQLLPSHHARLKYPNDVQVKEYDEFKKVSGIMVEHEFSGANCISTVVGIGINVLQKSFDAAIPYPCTSLSLCGSDVKPTKVLDILQRHFVHLCTQQESEVLSMWASALGIPGQIVYVKRNGQRATCVALRPDGHLEVRIELTKSLITISDGEAIQYRD